MATDNTNQSAGSSFAPVVTVTPPQPPLAVMLGKGEFTRVTGGSLAINQNLGAIRTHAGKTFADALTYLFHQRDQIADPTQRALMDAHIQEAAVHLHNDLVRTSDRAAQQLIALIEPLQAMNAMVDPAPGNGGGSGLVGFIKEWWGS